MTINEFRQYVEKHFSMKFDKSGLLSPEVQDEDVWEEAYMGFSIQDDIPSVWQPDWENLDDDDYYGGEWVPVNSINEVAEYIKNIPEQRQTYLRFMSEA